MTTERRKECLKAIRGYVNGRMPHCEFKTDCMSLLDSIENEIPDGLAVRQEIATLLGLTPDDRGREELSAWFALPNIRAAIYRMKGIIEELDKRDSDNQQRLFHYEGTLAEITNHLNSYPLMGAEARPGMTIPERVALVVKLRIQLGEMAGQFADQISPPPPHSFKIGDRCLYNLRQGFDTSLEIPVKIVNITPKRIRIKDIGSYGLTRSVMAKSLRIDPSPSPES